MKTRALRLLLIAIATAVVLPVALAIVLPETLVLTSTLSPAKLRAVLAAYPKYTLEQRTALLHETYTELHPKWKNLTATQQLSRLGAIVRRATQPAAAAAATASAQFLGNLTVIENALSQAVLMQRQPNCSLTLYSSTYTMSLTPTIDVTGTTANYEQTLHSEAGLTTQADLFAHGCAEATTGIGIRRAAFLGKTTQNLLMGVGTGYDFSAGTNVLYYGTIEPTTQMVHSFKTDGSAPNILGVAVGDLNGDGLADVVGIDPSRSSITVWLAHADGTLSAATTYVLPNDAQAAVVADVNGDGKADVVAVSRDSSGQEQISVLTGNGDGTFNAAQSMSIPSLGNQYLENLVAADLRGTGHPDIVGSNGLELLNNGSGTFTVASPAFAPIQQVTNMGPTIAAADFNGDGKLDLAVDNGASIHIYLGNGDGTFTPGQTYTSINDAGFLTATDLDGDGKVDLYVGLANGGLFGSDVTGASLAYALMGNGDGTFKGAPELPFLYTGDNIADLNGDGAPDAVGLNSDFSFTTYLNDGKGGFTAAGTLVTSPITIGGTQPYPLSGIDSYGLADVNGDGVPDLVYIAVAPNGIPNLSDGTGVFVALGNGHGGFGTPTFFALTAVPSSISGAYTIYPTPSNLKLADLNHDGRADLVYYYTYPYYNVAASNTYVNAGTAVQLGNGDGTFQAAQLISYYSGPVLSNWSNYTIPYTSEVALIEDLNRDGNPDLIFVTDSSTSDIYLSSYRASIQVALGQGDGTFSPLTTVAGPDYMVQGQPSELKVADMNGDGIPDIVALGSSTTYDVQVAVSLGNGDGTFKAPILKTFAGQYLNPYQGLAVADFNGDGKLDVAIADPYVDSNRGITLGNGDGSLHGIINPAGILPDLVIGVTAGGASLAADLNGDGLPDLLAGNVELLAKAGGSSAAPGYTLGVSSSVGTVTAGASATTSVTLSATGGFSGSVSLSCSGLPVGAACAFSPATVALTGASATSSMTLATTARAAQVTPAFGRGPLAPWLPDGVVLAGLMIPWVTRRGSRTGNRRDAWVACLLLTAAVLSGCGGSSGSSEMGSSSSGGSSSSSSSSSSGGVASGTPAGHYTVMITASSGTSTQTLGYALTVN